MNVKRGRVRERGRVRGQVRGRGPGREGRGKPRTSSLTDVVQRRWGGGGGGRSRVMRKNREIDEMVNRQC